MIIIDKDRETLTKMGFRLLSEYLRENRNSSQRRVIVSDTLGYRYDIEIRSLIGGSHPEFVNVKNPFSLQNISRWLVNNHKPFELCKENTYLGSDRKLKWHCSICGEFFFTNWNGIFVGQGCAVCAGKQVGQNNSLAQLRPDLVEEWSSNNVFSAFSVRLYSHKVVEWVCSKCGYTWNCEISNRTNVNSGCPQCSASKGEQRIRDFLRTNKHEFFEQKRFSECRDKNPLPFDFYLPEFKLCIEFHGEQHYQESRLFKRCGGLLGLKKRDRIKKLYCQKHEIILIVIPYWDYTNIENILSKALL